MIFHSSAMNGLDLSSFTQDEIKNEPMLFSAGWAFASEYGGPITREFLAMLMEDDVWYTKRIPFDSIVIDSRVHMLMPGWYPCIPGWHHDDVARTRKDGQPNYKDMPYKSEHASAIIGDVSVTEFLFGKFNLTIPKLGATIYKDWNDTINKKLKRGIDHISRVPIETNKIIYFDWATFHRGMPATHSGWRMFIRASWNTKRPILNEIRKQSQVYMSALEAGW